MERAIEQRLAGAAAGSSTSGICSTDRTSITELVLDGCPISEIRPEEAGLLQQFPNIRRLTLNRTGLSSLNNFPSSKSLRILELTDNRLSEDFHIIVEACPNLTKLDLQANLIQRLDAILSLAKLNKLEQLELDGNEVTECKNYRETIWSSFPNLTYLDCFDRQGNEIGSKVENAEDYEDGENDTTLKDFYEKNYSDEDEDDDDFYPNGEEEDDEDIEEEDEEQAEDDTGEDGEESDVVEEAEAEGSVEKEDEEIPVEEGGNHVEEDELDADEDEVDKDVEELDGEELDGEEELDGDEEEGDMDEEYGDGEGEDEEESEVDNLEDDIEERDNVQHKRKKLLSSQSVPNPKKKKTNY